MFEIGYFKQHPKPFYSLAKDLLPEGFHPTPSHYFVKLLYDKGLLLRHYTQNVDGLERLAGVPDDKIVEAHGSFHLSHCTKCEKEFSFQWMRGTPNLSLPWLEVLVTLFHSILQKKFGTTSYRFVNVLPSLNQI